MCRSRRPTRANKRAVSEYYFEADHHVVDLSVASGKLAGSQARHPSAHGGDIERLRKVSDRKRMLGNCSFQIGAEGASEHFDHTRSAIHRYNTLQFVDVEHHTTKNWYRRTAHTTATCSHRDWHIVRRTDTHSALHFVGVAR